MRRVQWIAFRVAEGALWTAYMALDLLGGVGTEWIKFSAIALCAVFALLSRSRLIGAALVLSAAADVFLLLLDRRYALGVTLFLAVQLLHCLRLCRMRGVDARADLTLRLIIGAIAALCVIKMGPLSMLAAGYIAVFGFNTAEAIVFAARSRGRMAKRYAAGLALFFCCDLCVGVTNLTGSVLAALGMWAFYLPGQVLIVSSAQEEA